MTRSRRLDAAWIVGWMLYILAGTAIVPFHGDEAMQIEMSRDAWAAVRGDGAALLVEPPYSIDSDAQLRLLNGTINRYAIGVAWMASGADEIDLPPHPGWDWGLSYADNVATDHRPPPDLLSLARAPSAILTALALLPMAALGQRAGGRWGGWLAVALFALQPAILLNGRRATQEGAMLLFGLLTVWIGSAIAARRAAGKPIGVGWWIGLAIGAALAVASKHSAIVFAAGAWTWVVANELRLLIPHPPAPSPLPKEGNGEREKDRAENVRVFLALVIAGVAAIGGFVALSPALWNDPIARAGDLLMLRSDLVAIQITIDPRAPLSLRDRVGYTIAHPFLTPPQFHELPSWQGVAAIDDEIARYQASAWAGGFTAIVGAALTLLMFGGAGVLLIPAARRRANINVEAAIGVLAWGVLATGSLMLNPLPWQRYFLVWTPIAVLMAAAGAIGLWRVIVTSGRWAARE